MPTVSEVGSILQQWHVQMHQFLISGSDNSVISCFKRLKVDSALERGDSENT